ncbi:MAG: NTP transferase domain-containing protein [Alicyclobacillaceae bacterium]|nr:NTP transferase domain-containing protein [Alicyclobacillaceae bacterium]
MGIDKGMLDIGGRPLIFHLARQVRDLGLPCTIVLSPAAPARAGRYQALVPWATFVFDRESGRGPVAGIEAGTGATRAEWVFLLSCDIPDLCQPLFHAMQRLATTPLPGGSFPEAVYVEGEPFHGLYRRQPARQAARHILQTSRPSARAWQRLLHPAWILPASRPLWHNLNTPDDYRRYLERTRV